MDPDRLRRSPPDAAGTVAGPFVVVAAGSALGLAGVFAVLDVMP